MTDRYRNFDARTNHSGTCTKHNTLTGAVIATYVSAGSQGMSGECWDTHGERDKDNPLIIRKVQTMYPFLSGSSPSTPPYYPKWVYHDEYVITGQYSAIDPETRFPLPSAAALQEAGALGAARCNPGRPHIGLPTALGEARELPKMFSEIPEAIFSNGSRFLGEIAGRGSKRPFGGLGSPAKWLREAANANLAWRFGWSPFISDLAAMLGLTAAINQRLKLLGELAAGKTIRRRYHLPEEKAYYDEGWKTTQSIGALLSHRKETNFTSQSWVSTQWKLQDGVSLPTAPDELADLARDLALGLNGPGGLAAAWELTPWSWLHDWFFGLGDWLGANNNALPVTLAGCCWMRTCESFTSMTPAASNPTWVHLDSDYWMRMVVKRRVPLGTVLPLLPSLPHLPALTGGQLGILGSLATQLGLRRG